MSHDRSSVLACYLLTIIGAFCGALPQATAQGTRADYERADELQSRVRDTVFRDRVDAHWLSDGARFWYDVSSGPGQREWILVDAALGEKRPAFDHQRLADAIGSATGKEISADDLPLRAFRLADDAGSAEFSAFGKRWKCDLESYTLDERGESDANGTTVTVLDWPRRSRDGGPSTSIRFINRTERTVRLVWLDNAGGRTPYGEQVAGAERDQHTYAGHTWLVTDEGERPLAVFSATDEAGTAVIDGTQRLRDRPRRGRGRRGRGRGNDTSPDGRWQATIKDHNAYLRDADPGDRGGELKLTADGTAEDAYQSRFYWSPDSTRLVVIQEKAGENRQIHLIESSPRDKLQPKLHTLDYAKPGDRLPVPRPRLFDLTTMRQIPVAEDLLPNPWSITDIRWQGDSRRFTFLYNQRGHQVLRIVVVDADTGSAAALVDETSDTFIDYAGKSFSRYLDDAHEIIWMSERDGWNHLYLFDSRTGSLKNQITRGAWVVRGVDRVDAEGRQIWFRAGGIFPEQDPYYVHYCRVNFDGTDLVVLTNGNGTHDVDYSPDRQFIVDRFSRVDMPPVTELRRADDGSLVCELERADWSALLATDWQTPEPFVAKGRDGKTDIYGVIIRPTNFDPVQKYPVIEKIYAGPQGSFVPKQFATWSDMQSLAELGFIVVQIDGMGTSNRSKAFHDVCAKNLVDAGLPDRILWMKAAAAKHSEMDLSRVGIYGGSAGGQSALGALLTHGDFYKVGVADCGCHDNRMDKVWWNELWMGWPVGSHYAEQSNVTLAPQLTGKLLLIVGELDRNVDPASTMQVVDALIKADKDFDLLLVPGAGHGAGGGPYGTRRTRDFFVRHLLGVEPRHE